MAASRRCSPVFLTSRPSPNHRCVRRAKRIDVDADARPDPSRPAAAVPQEDRDRLIGLPRHDPGRYLHRAAASAELDHVFVFDAEPSRRRRAQKRRAVPRELRERLGQFLKPAVVRVPAVPDRRVGSEDDLQASRSVVRSDVGFGDLLDLGTTALGFAAVPLTTPASSASRHATSKSPASPCRFQYRARSPAAKARAAPVIAPAARVPICPCTGERSAAAESWPCRQTPAGRSTTPGNAPCGMCQWQSRAVSSSYRPRWIRSLVLFRCQHPGKVQIRRCVVGRVASQDDQRLDLAGLDVRGPAREASRSGRPAPRRPAGKTQPSCRCCPAQ